MLLALAWAGWTQLRLDTGIESTLGRSVPAVEALLDINASFDLGEEVRIMLRSRDGKPLPDEALASLRSQFEASPVFRRLAVAARLSPSQRARAWALNQLPTGRAWLDQAAVLELRERLSEAAMSSRFERHRLRLSTTQPAEVTRQLMKDPLALRDLVPESLAGFNDRNQTPLSEVNRWVDDIDPLLGEFNAKGDAWLLRLGVPFPASDLAKSAALYAEWIAIAGTIETTHPGVQLDLAGPHFIAAETSARVRADIQRSLVFAGVGIFAVFVIVWRRITAVALLFACTALALVTAFGLYGLTGWALSPLAALCGGMLAGLGIDYGVHVLNDLEHADERNDAPDKRYQQPSSLFRPIATACLTTTCGFLALAATEPQALKQLALLGALGLLSAGFASVTLLPVFASLLNVRIPRMADRSPAMLVWISAHGGPMRGIALICIALLIALAVTIDGRDAAGQVHDLHPDDNPALLAQGAIDQRFDLKPGSVLVLLASQGISQMEVDLRELDRLSIPFDVISATSLLPPLDQNERNAALLQEFESVALDQRLLDAAEDTGFVREAFAPAAAFVERFVKTPSSGLLELAESEYGRLFFPRDFDPAEPRSVAVLIPKADWTSSVQRRQDLAALEAAIARLPNAEATGIDFIGETIRQQIPRDLLLALAWSALPILIALSLAMRRVSRIVLTLLPPVVGLFAAIVVMRLGSGHWNAINLAAIPLILGIGVDASVLLIDAQRRRSVALVRVRLRGVHLTIMTTLIGFGSLVMTSIPAVRELGAMVIAGLVAVLIVTWLFIAASKRFDS
ncbi:MAG: MMPL family transporter [Phycisphaeraceae bacterium]